MSPSANEQPATVSPGVLHPIDAPSGAIALARARETGATSSLQDIPRFLTTDELAEWLGMSAGTIRHMVSRGDIPYRKVGRNVRFLVDEIVEWTLPPSRRRRRR